MSTTVVNSVTAWVTDDRLESSPFEQGEKTVIIGSRHLFQLARDMRDAPAQDAVARLSIVQLEIIERRVVCGDYEPQNVHYGFRAKGSDGWFYHCQFRKFDDLSHCPYLNWQREFVEGVHYTAGTGNNARLNWLIPEEDGIARLLNWSANHAIGYLAPIHQAAVVAHINERYPDCQISQCSKTSVDSSGKTYPHSEAGDFFNASGCIFCQYEKNSAELKKQRIAESV